MGRKLHNSLVTVVERAKAAHENTQFHISQVDRSIVICRTFGASQEKISELEAKRDRYAAVALKQHEKVLSAEAALASVPKHESGTSAGTPFSTMSGKGPGRYARR